jgi:hypothetical protein
MKKRALTLGLFLAGVSIILVEARSYAAPVQAASYSNAKSTRLESIKKACNPTPDQVTKVQNLLNDLETANTANEKANKGNHAAWEEANKKNTYDFNEKLAKVLTPEQLKSLNAADIAWEKEHKKKDK